MSPTTSIQVFERPASADGSVSSCSIPPKTPRSLLKNLFIWKRAPVNQYCEGVMASDPSMETEGQATSKQHQHVSTIPKPPLTHRSRSDVATTQQTKARSKSRRRSRSRCRAVWDPPPLFQAYNQAFMHDTLQVPNKGLLDWLPRNSSNRSSAKLPDGTEDEKMDACSPSIGHRRSMSDSSTSSLSKKLFFVFENGHILQYKAEGSPDRLPERVIELSRDSVAFASDAVVGQHWVLEICPYGRNDEDNKISPSKSTWSRMTLKSTDNKRLSDKLLLVFDSPDTLFTWLIAIRKQIEGFGGLEYQPDAPPLPQPEGKRPTLRHASSEYFKRKNGNLFSRSTSNLPLKLDDHTAHEKDLPKLPDNLSYQGSVSTRSDATSSIGTSASLDKYRESYSGSSSAGTTLSSAVSASSLSPTKEAFSPTLKSMLAKDNRNRVIIDRSLPKPPTSPLYKSKERSASPDVARVRLFDKALPSVGLQSHEDDEVARVDNRLTYASLSSQMVNGRGGALSTYDAKIAEDTEAILELRSRLKEAKLKLSAADTEAATSALHEERASTSCHTRKLSLGTVSKGNYGLFPKRLSMDAKEEPVGPEESNLAGHRIAQSADAPNISASASLRVTPAFSNKLSARSNTTSKRPGPIALPHLLALTEIESPMRTPAVTDAMLDTNFGTMPSGAATEPATPIQIRVPSFGDMKFDTNLLKSFQKHKDEAKSPPASPKAHNLSSRRSLPNFHYNSASMISAPVGPPPSGPLPAVPTINDSVGNRTSPPSKRASVQSTNNRRASTKSVTSAKKGRSRAPSLTYQPTPTRVSLPAGVQSAALTSAHATSPIPKIDVRAFTIGQLSIVPSPPPIPGIPSHKKSLSTSSAKSHRSKKGHARTNSGKSMHGTGSSIPSFSHLITPSCAFDTDADFSEKGCFGIPTPRTGTL